MNTKKNKRVRYTEDKGAMAAFGESAGLTREEQTALGIPPPEEAISMRVVRKAAKPERINIRMPAGTVAALKARAAEAGIPYQTLAAAALYQIATGKVRLELVAGER